MAAPFRIRCADAMGNIAYIIMSRNGEVRCMLASGTSASLFHAGISYDEAAARFALEDCKSPDDALKVVRRLGSPVFQYTPVRQDQDAADGTSSAPPAVFLRLFHGRGDPNEDLEDWGSEGPVIGPLAYVQVTYMCDIRFAAAPEIMERFFPDVILEWRARDLANARGPLCDWRFDMQGDLILYDGVYYGDWSITAQASLVDAAASDER